MGGASYCTQTELKKCCLFVNEKLARVLVMNQKTEEPEENQVLLWNLKKKWFANRDFTSYSSFMKYNSHNLETILHTE